MRCGVIGADGAAAGLIHFQFSGLTICNAARAHFTYMDKQISRFTGVCNNDRAGLGHYLAMIADLATAFRIEGSLVQHYLHRCAIICDLLLCPVADHRDNLPFGVFRVIAQEICSAMRVEHIKPDGIIRHFARASPSGTGLSFLCRHCRVKPICVHRHALFTQSILGEIQRKPEGVIKFKRSCAEQGPTCA